MDRYKILCETNRKQIFGEEISDEEKKSIVSILLKDINPNDILSELKIHPHTEKAPYFYYPPYQNGKRMRLIQGYLPKTNILYSNHYELEILRLLAMYAPSESVVETMVEATIQRLQNTCFGKSCTVGECLAAGISVLRLLAVVKVEERWMDALLQPLGEAFMFLGEGGTTTLKNLPLSYLLMALTDINNKTTINLIDSKKEVLLDLLNRGKMIGKSSKGTMSEREAYQLMNKQIISNALDILPN